MRTSPPVPCLAALRCLCGVTFIGAGLAGAAVAADGPEPPPGLYEVGQVATLEVRSPPANVQRLTQETDGHTGDRTVMRSVEPSGGRSTERYPGQGPVQACIRPGRPPAWLQAQACGPDHRVKAPDGRLVTVDCVPAPAGGRWRRIDDQRWEQRYEVALSPAGSSRTSPATAAAMAPAIAAMESAMKSAPPAEAEAMRRQLDALRGGSPAAVQRTWQVTERWKRLADRCP